jgi:NAD(P)-dependent dehydrogenase (short-subunit alcohol dehydrogenase family)
MTLLKGKTAIITGAGLGIGRAAALLFASHGANVVIAECDEATGAQAAADVAVAGGSALFVRTDVTRPDSVEAMVARTVAAFGGIDVLYNNAGGSTTGDGPVTTVPIDEFWHTVNVDLYGTFLCCRFAIPHMIEANGGAVINTSSMVALIGRKNAHAYTASKGGVTSLTRALAAEYGEHNIRVNAVAPGVTRSERVEQRLAAGRIQQYVLDRHVLGLPEPIDVAHAALYLASDLSSRVTGQILPVDSGMTAF